MTTSKAKATATTYQHIEAFCLMRYESKDGREVEYIWNSRDGVTPFVVHSRLGTELQHSSWITDERIAGFRPQPGSRIFVDLTPERAREQAEALAKHGLAMWEQSHGILVDDEREGDRQAGLKRAVDRLVATWLSRPGLPDVIVVPATEDGL